MSITWIEASAGTGKTYTLVQKVVGLLTDGGLEASAILLVTFTDKATAELKTRIREGLRQEWKRTRDPRLAQALEDLASLSITTIHGFCRTLLTQFPLESGISFEPELVDQGQRWRRLLRDGLRPRLADLDPALLFWAGWEDEEDFLGQAREALNRDLFHHPVAHPTPAEAGTFHRFRQDLEGRTGPLWAALDQARDLGPLAEDSTAGLGAATIQSFLHASWHKKPYRAFRSLQGARDFRDLPALLHPEVLEALAKWDPTSNLWKKGAPEALPPRLEALQGAALAFVGAVEAWESALEPGVSLRNFLAGCARHELLEAWARPVLDRRSDRELTFHDLIDRVHGLVTAPGASALADGASARWRAVLIDEFQDTDPRQWAIFRALFARGAHGLTLVGDPKQSIYRFRGADLEVYRRVRDEVRAQGAETRVLEHNYRSTQAMVEAVNHLFDPARAPWDHPDDFHPSLKGDKPIAELARQTDAGTWEALAPVEVFLPDTEQAWHRHLVKTVLELLDGRHFLVTPGGGEAPAQAAPVTPGDILILVRQKREAWQLHRLLSARGVPATVGGSGGLLQGREAQEILLFLKALESPRSPSAARALAWTRPFAGASADALAPALEAAQADRDRGAYLGAFRRVAAALEAGVVDGGGLEGLLAQAGGTRIVTNLEHVLELVQERAHRGEVAPGQAALALETWISSGLQEDEVDLRRDTETRTLRLLTIHAAKGLEAPIVLHGKPSEGQDDTGPWLVHQEVDFLRTEAFVTAEAGYKRAEDLRLRYVALTRARTHQVFADAQVPGARAVPEIGFEAWRALGSWKGSEAALAPSLELAPGVEGLEARHPWVESHSGLWRRATRDEAPAPTVWDRPRSHRDDEAGAEGVPAAGPLADELPAGPAFGDLVHDILEGADYRGWAPGAPEALTRPLRAGIEELCRRQRAAFQNRDLSRPLGQWLGRVLAQPLDLGPGTKPLTFTDLAPEDSRRELEFHLPLAHRQTGRFDWGGRTFTVHPGYLTGRIDLLFRWEGRLWLADWKTNRLAPGQEPAEVMAEAGYDLQAQWYWEALKRLCALQGEALTPGGVLYVFLRGAGDRSRGVFLSPSDLDGRTTLTPFLKELARG